MAPATDLQHALNGLAAWARNHGIYEVREALEKAAGMATECETNEALADDLEALAVLEGPLQLEESPRPPAKPHKEHKPHKEPATGEASPPPDGDPGSPAA
jgi:hypothetical protein